MDLLCIEHGFTRRELHPLPATTGYKVLFPSTTTGVTSSDVRTRISSRSLGAGWAHDTGSERLAFSSSVTEEFWARRKYASFLR